MEGEKLKCPSCGTENEAGDEFCTECGTSLQQQEEQQIPLPVVVQEIGPSPPLAEKLPAVVTKEAPPVSAEEVVPVEIPTAPIQVEINGATDIGCVRKNNEDCFSITTHTYPSKNIRVDFMVLCDGMGGHAAGEVASHLGVKEDFLKD